MELFQEVKAAFGDGTNNTDTVAYLADATPRRVALPSAFVGNIVRIRVVGAANLQYFFSTSATSAIVAAVPSAGGQQAATLGEAVSKDSFVNVRVPSNNGQPVYFCWVCDGAGTGVWITKASGIPGSTVGDR